MTRWRRDLLLCFVLALFIGCFPVLSEDSPADLIARADLAYMSRHVRETMTEAIGLYEAVLPNLSTLSEWNQAYVLNRLSQLCYEAALFDDGHTPEDEELYTNGKDYAFRSLRRHSTDG